MWAATHASPATGSLSDDFTLPACGTIPGMAEFAALLRGINVGRHNRIAMADLRQLLTGLGFTQVNTLLQSGNAVFDVTSGPREPADLAAIIEKWIAAELGLAIGCVVVTTSELARIVAAHPLRAVATDPARLLVYFLSGTPEPDAFADLDDSRPVAETFVLGQREIHVWAADGVQQSMFTPAFLNKRLPGLTATARNWNTVLKLLAMMD